MTSFKNTLAAILVTALACAGVQQLALAAEANADGDQAATEPEATEPEADGPASEVFIPTEEISEDFAVSFPVDI